MATPIITYSYFSYGKMKADGSGPETIILNQLPAEKIATSFKNGFNSITIKLSSDTPIDYYEIRIARADGEYGIGKGTLWYTTTNIPGDQSLQTINLDINSTYFPSNTNYIIGLYGKADNGYWDVTYLLLSSDNYIIAPSDYDGIEMLTNQDIPTA